MQSFLIVSNESPKTQAYLTKFYKENEVDTFAITTLTLGLTPTGKPAESIGIADIRILHKTLFLKAAKGAKAIVIQNAQMLTDEAQNALLKVLEEPPPNTYFFLVVEKKESVLPTILSRCFVVDLTTVRVHEKPEAGGIALFEKLQGASVAEKMHYAQTIGKTKAEALMWLTETIHAQRNQLVEQLANDEVRSVRELAKSLRALSLAHKSITTSNTNLTLTLEHLLFNL